MIRLIAATSLALALSACAPSYEWSAAMKARQTAPGRGIDGQCAVFADYVAARVPGARTVTFQISAPNADVFPQLSVRHKLVMWEVRDEIWAMDQSSPPIWVGRAGDTLDSQIRQFYATRHNVISAHLRITTAIVQ